MEIQQMHLVIVQRANVQDEGRLELERVQTTIAQQHTEDLWRMGMLMHSPFVYLSKGKKKEVKAGGEGEEKGGRGR